MGVVSKVVLSGHDLHTRRGANRCRIAVGKPYPLFCHLVDVGRFIVFTAVATERFPAHVVSHNQNDIGWAIVSTGGRAAKSD